MNDFLTHLEAELHKAHVKDQALRFVRIAAFTALPLLVAMNGRHLDWTAVGSVCTAALETAFRQIFPAVTSASVSKAADSATPPAVQ